MRNLATIRTNTCLKRNKMTDREISLCVEPPEALRLAGLWADYLPGYDKQVATDTAAELRRLHEENAELWKEREEPHKTIAVLIHECNRLESERDELLHALKKISAIENLDFGDCEEIEQAREIADAAIKKIEGKL